MNRAKTPQIFHNLSQDLLTKKKRRQKSKDRNEHRYKNSKNRDGKMRTGKMGTEVVDPNDFS